MIHHAVKTTVNTPCELGSQSVVGLFAVPENPTLEPKITTLSYTELEL